MRRPNRAQFDKICRLCLDGTELVNIFDRHPKTQRESLSSLVRETVEMLGLVTDGIEDTFLLPQDTPQIIESDDNFPKKICVRCKGFLRQLYKFRNQCQEASDLLAEALSFSSPRENILSPPPLSELSEPTTSLPPSLPTLPPPHTEIEQRDETSTKPTSPKPQILIIPTANLVKQEYIRQPSPVPSIPEAETTEQDTIPPVPLQPESTSTPEADSSNCSLPIYVDVKAEITHSIESTENFEDPDDDCSEEYYEYLEPETEDIEEEVVTNDPMHLQDEETCITEAQEEFSVVQHVSEMDQAEEEEAEETETENEWNTVQPVKLSQSDSSKYGKGQECQICGKSSTCLKYHMMCHTGERPYSCRYCDKTFRTSTKLNIHVNGVHLKVRKYVCEICDKKFLDAGNLRNHMVTHGGERKFVCDFEGCGKSFALQGTLTVHKKVHTQDKQFGCEFCSKTFLYKWLLVKHHRTHTGERPYECDICCKKFSTITHMHTHKKTHDPTREKKGRKRKQPSNHSQPKFSE